MNFLSGVGVKVLLMLIPTLMPLATSAITAWINGVVKSYVPRPVQVALSTLLGAIAAALASETVGIPAEVAMSAGAIMGGVGQTFASLKPDTLLASAPSAKDVKPA